MKASARASGIAFALLLGLCIAAGAIGGTVTAGSVHAWYAGLHKPPFNPPDWVFGPVWSVLYLMMAVAAWRVWRRDRRWRSAPLAAWALQLLLNLGWSVIFFGLHAPGLALADLALLLVAVGATAFLFGRKDLWAGLLMIPYLLWCGFAFLLNYEVWRLNP